MSITGYTYIEQHDDYVLFTGPRMWSYVHRNPDEERIPAAWQVTERVR